MYDTGLGARRGQVRRDVACTLGLLVVLFNLAAGIAVETVSPRASWAERALKNGWTIICSAYAGPTLVDAAGRPIEFPDTDTPAHTPHCLFCFPLMQGDALALPLWQVPPPAFGLSGETLGSHRPLVVASTFPSGLWPRAPPVPPTV